MTSQKKKKESVEQAETKSSQKLVVPSSEPTEDLSSEILSSWEHVVTELVDKEFGSIEEAVQTISEQVVDRLNLESSERDGTVEFLKTLLSTDPIIEQELRASLRIVGK